jgi:hypothetical protein
MSSIEEKSEIGKSSWLKWSAAVAPGALLFVSFMYQWGYWDLFGVRFLNYMSLNEVIYKSVFSVFSIVMLCLGYCLIGLISSSRIKDQKIKIVPSWRDRIIPVVSVIIMIILVIVSGLAENSKPRLIVTVLPFGFGYLGYIGNGVFFERIKPEKAWFVAVVFGLASMLCYYFGYFEANAMILRPQNVGCIVRTDLGDPQNTEINNCIYVGRMGGYLFLSSKNGHKTLAIPEGHIKSIERRRIF